MRFGLAGLCTLLLLVGGRLVQLQALNHGAYADAASAQRLDTVAMHALRGSIVDRDGSVLAYTSDAQDITVDPQQIPAASRPAYAAALAPLVGLSPAQVETALAQPGQYAVVATGQSPVIAGRIANLHLVGVYTEATTQRQYPGHTTAANVIGTVHSDGTGAAGIEYLYNGALAGKDGQRHLRRRQPGQRQPDQPHGARRGPQRRDRRAHDRPGPAVRRPAGPGHTRCLRSGARGAEAAILDAHTGQVLALASSGHLRPRRPEHDQSEPPIDPPVMSAFEPGSVQKAITFAAAVEQKLITPSTVHVGAEQHHHGWRQRQ